MAKHLMENKKRNENKPTENANEDNFYGRIIARQGEGLIEKENKIKELENRLVQERMNRIEDLKTIESWATSNCYNNEKTLLRKVAEIAADKRKKLTSINTNKKELSSHTDQSI